FGNNFFPGQAVAVWVADDATVDHFINHGTISAVEGTTNGPAGFNNFSTAHATATGMRIDGGVPLLTNDGLIRGLAFAHDSFTGNRTATATARGINWDFPSSPSIRLENSGHVQATASAYADAAAHASANAHATAVRMFMSGSTELAAVQNSGGITANAHAFATSHVPDNSAFAQAEAFGVDNHIFANSNGTAIITNYASGNISANALAHTLAPGDATSYATASNHQFVSDNSVPGFNGSASVKN